MQKRIISLEMARALYGGRFTMEHVPSWAHRPPILDGGTETRFYAPQYRTDLEWYQNTAFPGEPEHILGAKHGGCCDSRNMSWPLGQWLDKPYRKGA